jgi:hypothetical protein
MEELLNKVSELIEASSNIPQDIKPIVKAICRGYIRESNGMIPISGIINVCNTVFKGIEPSNKEFSKEENILGMTDTDYDKDGKVIHGMSYVKDPNVVKLISILVHELGHVITEPNSNQVMENGIYPILKKTTSIYLTCGYKNGELLSRNGYGFRMADGFLESICTKIFASDDFRRELLLDGFDLEDYEYKDPRLFPSRVYDDYKACFELFDYIMNGALFEFSCRTFDNDGDMVNFINEHKLNLIFEYLDKSNDRLWDLKKFEGKEFSEEFGKLLSTYLDNKQIAIEVAKTLLPLYGKSEDDPRYIELLNNYKNTLSKQNLPIPKDILEKNRSNEL